MKALLLASTLTLLSANALAGVSNPPTYPIPPNPAGWCTAVQLAPGTVRTTQIGDCPAPPVSTCPSGRQTVAQVCYRYGPTSCINTDVTDWSNLWGRGTPTEQPIPFPGKQVFAIVKNMQKSQYISAKFVAPLSPSNQYGLMYTTETTSGPPTDFSISSRCGEFTTPDWRCYRSNVLPGHVAGSWKLPANTAPALCPLIPGNTYYFNFKIHNPNVQHFDCSGSVCKVGIQNNHTP